MKRKTKSLNEFKKKILCFVHEQLYLIWFGDSYVDENETSNEIGGILGEVALRSGGEIFRITEESLSNGDLGLVSLLHLDFFSFLVENSIIKINNKINNR